MRLLGRPHGRRRGHYHAVVAQNHAVPEDPRHWRAVGKSHPDMHHGRRATSNNAPIPNTALRTCRITRTSKAFDP